MANKEKQFVRSHPMPGVYGICHKRKQIQIKGREIYSTADQSLIKVFENDPEIMEFKVEIKTPNEILNYEDMKEAELLKLAKARGLEKNDVVVKDTTREGLIQELKEYDEINSKPENDQGERAPDENE